MNKKQTGKFGVLAVTMLLIISFVKGRAEILALLTAAALWLLWAFFPYFVVAFRDITGRLQKAALKRQAQMQQRKEESLKQSPLHESIASAPSVDKPSSSPVSMDPANRETLLAKLMQQLNLRITEKLHIQYPESTWCWCVEHPEELAMTGGTARIAVSGIESFNYADVSMDLFGQLRFNMLCLVPLEDAKPAEDTCGQSEGSVETEYDLQWRPVLLEIIKKLTPHGHKRLFIKENGDICIYQGEEQQTEGVLANFPAKEHWSDIGELLKQDKLRSKVNGDVLVVLW